MVVAQCCEVINAPELQTYKWAKWQILCSMCYHGKKNEFREYLVQNVEHQGIC